MIKGVSNTCVTTVPWMGSDDIVPYHVGCGDNARIYSNSDENISWLPALDNGQGLIVRWSEDEAKWDVYFYSVQLEKF